MLNKLKQDGLFDKIDAAQAHEFVKGMMNSYPKTAVFALNQLKNVMDEPHKVLVNETLAKIPESNHIPLENK